MTLSSKRKKPYPRKPKPPLLSDHADQREAVKRSKKHEERVAGKLGGRRVRRSGGMRYSKNYTVTEGHDLGCRLLKGEHKFVRPATGSISVKREWLMALLELTKRLPQEPALLITFEGMKPHQDWILMPLAVVQKRLGLEVDE